MTDDTTADAAAEQPVPPASGPARTTTERTTTEGETTAGATATGDTTSTSPPPTDPGAWPPPPPSSSWGNAWTSGGPSTSSWTTELNSTLGTLRRSSSHRVIGGVASGIAQRAGIDPLIVRVAFVVLAFFGGVGVLLYALGALLMPEDVSGRSVLDQARGRGGAANVFLALGLGILILAVGGSLIFGSFDSAALLLLVVVGVVVLLRRGPNAVGGFAPPPRAAATANGPMGFTTGPAADPMYGPETFESSAYREWNALPPEPPTDPTWGVLAPEPVRRPRSILFPLTVSAILIALGIMGLVEMNGSVEDAAWLAVPLAIIGAGLLVGAWYGRSRGLIFLGAVAALGLIPATAATEFDEFPLQDPRDVVVQPRSIAAIDDVDRRYGPGTVLYDLSALEFAGQDVDLSIEMPAGELTVILPPDVTAIVDAEANFAGEINVLGESSEGVGPSVQTTDEGTSGSEGGTIRLDLSVGAGAVTVTR